MRFAIIALISLTGCGTVNQLRDGTAAESILISEGKAGGMYALLSGEIEQCHVVKYGKLKGLTVVYKGIKCTVTVGNDD